MKKTLQIFALLFICLINAQAPEKFSYQAVIRNASNALVTNAPVGVKISIIKSSAAGTVVYAETQNATTNANGLISIQIGAGTVVSGTIAGINWGVDSYYIKTETDPAGGSSYSISGTSQLLSVPYAMYSKYTGSGAALTLPYVGSNGADADTFAITNFGANYNIAGNFTNSSPTNAAPAILGTNNSTGLFQYGVEGTANSNTNGKLSAGVHGYVSGTGTTGAGIFGQATNAYGVYGSSTDGSGIYGNSFGTGTAGIFQAIGTGKALFAIGPVKLISIGESAGKVLTSDAVGNATWQDVVTPDIHFSSTGGSTQTIGGGVVVINSWTGLEESGGANYNATTGEYTVPVDGNYLVSAQLGFTNTPTSNAATEVIIRKNSVNLKFGRAPIVPASFFPSCYVSMEMKLVAGDKIAIGTDHNYPSSLFLQGNLSGFSIHLIHK